MSKRNGFTLVELMVVIVIIGVLAAVAIPKMMAATNKAKASEGPQMLGAIANMEAAFKTEHDVYIDAAQAVQGTATGAWDSLGFDQNPFSRYFNYNVEGAAADTFLAVADLKVALGKAAIGKKATIDQKDERKTDDTELGKLIPNWQ